jgi:autotransporter-associated beta strand protein
LLKKKIRRWDVANRVARVFLSGLAVVLGCSGLAAAGPMYWTGLQDGNWNTGGGGTAATNWSILPNSVSDPEVLPASTDDVYFTCNPASHLTTTLGQDFSIQGLTFTSNAVSPVTIGGNNTLTIGSDGVTIQNGSAAHVINAAVALGAAQTWTNLNSPGSGVFTVNGGISISGSAPLALAGAGGFVWGGGVTVNSGGSSINLNPAGSGGSATLTIAGTAPFARSPGGTLNFANTASTVSVPNMSNAPSNSFIGAWATIGSENNSGSLDWAIVNASNQIGAMSLYTTTAPSTWNSTSDVKLSSAQTLATTASTIHTLYMTGGGIMSLSSNTLTLAGGGILAYGGGGTYQISGGSLVSNAVGIGRSSLAAGSRAGTVTVATGIPDLVVNTSCNLNMNVSNIIDAPKPGNLTVSTTTGSNTITVLSGSNTSQLCPGTTVTVPGGGFSGATTITGIVDSTHFTVSSTATATTGSTTLTGTSHTGLTKTGAGLLDLSSANSLAGTFTFSGPVVVNGGTVLVNSDLELGAAPSSFNAAAVVLNGGEIDTTAPVWNSNRGVTVGPQGGTLSWVGASSSNWTASVTGPGGMTFSVNPYSTSGGTLALDVTGSQTLSYQGGTTLYSKAGSTILWSVEQQLPADGAVTLMGGGTVNLSGKAQTIGSLASAAGVGKITNIGLLTLGGSATSPVNQTANYGGTIAGTNANTGVVKNGGGTEILSGSNTYSGGTTINGGTLQIAGSGTLGSGPVSLGSGTTLVFNRADAFTVANPISGSGTLLQMGPGTLRLAGANTYVNTTINPGATLQINSASSVGSGVVVNSGSLVFNTTSEADFNGSLSGPGSLVQMGTGSGLLVLGGNQTYTGGTSVGSGAKLSVAAGSTPGASSSRLTLSGGTLSLNLTGTTSVSSGLSAQFGNLASGTTAEQPNFTSLANIQARIAGLVSSGGNGGTFPTTANGQSNLNFTNGDTYNGNNCFATIGYAGNGGFGNQYYDVLMSGSIAITQTGTYSFSTRSDDGSMLFIDGQQVVGNNNYQGAATATGTVNITTTGLHQIAVGFYQGNGGEGLDVQYEVPNSTTWAEIPNSILAGPVTHANPYGNPVTMTASSTLDVQPGVVFGGIATLGPLTVSSSGSTLTTTGTGSVSFQGTSLNGGAGSYGFTVNGTELVPGAITPSGAATINVGGSGILTLTATGGSQLAASSFQVNGGTLLAVGSNAFQGAPITLNNGGTLVLASTGGSAAYDILSGSPVTLAGTSVTILAGIGVSASPMPGALAAGGTTSATVTLASTGTLGIAAGQTLKLGSYNGYTLAVGPSLAVSNSGTLSVPIGTVAFPGTLAGSGTFAVGAGGSCAVNFLSATPLVTNNALNIQGNVSFGTGAGLTFTAPITLGGSYAISTSGYLNFANNIAGGGNQLDLRTGSNWGAGLTTLSGSNTLGSIQIEQGILAVASSAALGASGNTVALGSGNTGGDMGLVIAGSYTVPNPITVNNNGNSGIYLGGITAASSTFSGPITLNHKTVTLVAAPGGTATFSNVIADAPRTWDNNAQAWTYYPGSVVAGAGGSTGSVVLSGSNVYTGGTTVAYGTLALSGSGALAGSAGSVTVNAGATLGTLAGGNTNTIAGATTVNGTLAPAWNSPLAVSNTLTMNSGSTFALSASNGSVSQAIVNALTLPVSGTFNLLVTPLDVSTLNGGTYTFLTYNSGPYYGSPGNWNIVPLAPVQWAGVSPGLWDLPGNWSGFTFSSMGSVISTGSALQIQGITAADASVSGPVAAADVLIQASSAIRVTGPANAASVNSLTLGLTSGSLNELDLSSSGPLTVSGAAGTTVNASGYLNLSSGTLTTTALSIAGSASATSGGSLTASGAVAVTGTANFGTGTSVTLPGVTVSGAGQLTALGSGSIASLTLSGGTTTLGNGINVTAATASGSSIFTASGGTVSGLTLASGYSGGTSIGAAATVTIATIPSGTLSLSNSTNPMTSLTVTGGSVTTGPGVTAASVSINGIGAVGAAFNTGTNFLAVTNTLNVVNSAANITVTGGSFAVKGTNVASNIDTLRLSGGTTAVNYQAAAFLPGLEVRAWANDGGGTPIDGATFNYSTAPNPAPTNSTADGSIGYMTNAIHVIDDGGNPTAWFGATKGGATNGQNPTGYSGNFAVEYRGELFIANPGSYTFSTTSDDGSALWIDPSTDNPLYGAANVQNNKPQAMNRVNSTAVSLTAGYHEVIVRFNQGGGNDGLYVQWDPTGGSNVVDIPGGDFYHGGYVPGGAAMPNTNVVVAIASSFSPGNGYASTFGGLTLGGSLTFSGGSDAGTSASFSGIAATTTAAISNDATTSDVTAVAVASGGTVAVSANQTLTFNAPVTFGSGGTGAVAVTGAANAGTVVLASPATHLLAGNLNVNAGTLLVDGTLAGSGSLTVASGAILGGSGSIAAAGAGVTIQNGAHLDPHATAGGTNPLTIGSVATPSALTLAGGSILDFNMGPPGSTDTVQVNGGLTLGSGADALKVNGLTNFTYGTYEIIGYTGSLTNNSPTWTITHTGSVPASAGFALATPASGGPPGEIILTVSSGTATWTGAHGGNWNTSEADWTTSSSGTTYSTGALVIFPSGASNRNITVAAAGVSPASVTFTNTASTPYTLLAAGGPITGPALLTVSGGGLVTLNNTNSYSAGTLVAKGTLALGASGALPVGGAVTVSALGILDTEGYAPSLGTVTLSGGTLQSSVSGGSLTATSYVLQGGSVTLPLAGNAATLSQNASTTTLSAGNTYGGVTMVNAGTLVLDSNGSITQSAAINVGGGTAPATFSVAGTVGSAIPITVNAQGTCVLSSTGASTGTITVNSQGTLGIGASGMAAPAVTINPGGILAGLTQNAFAFSGGATITVPGQLQIAANGALGTPSGNLVMAVGSYYNFTAQQSSSPNLTVAAGMGLFGNTTNFDFNSAVTFQPDAIFLPSSGPSPTRAQLGGAATLLLPLVATDSGSVSVGDDGSTSIYRGLALGPWSTSGGAPLAAGAPVTLALTISDTGSNGFAVYMNGHDTTINSSTILNTSNTTTGAEFDGTGNLIFASTAGAGGTATVYGRVGVLNATTNTTGNTTLVSFASATNNLPGKALDLQYLTFSGASAGVLATNGTLNFGACAALSDPGVLFTQGTFNFGPGAIYRLDNDAAFGGGAAWSFQPGAMISLAYNPNTTALGAAASAVSNVDLICSASGGTQTVSGTNSIVLGNGRTISTPWNASTGMAVSSTSVYITAASGASSIHFAGANGQTLTMNVPLNLPHTTLQINDTPSNTLYVPADGDTNFQRQPGGSLLNGTVLLENPNPTVTPSTVSAVNVAGGTLVLGSSGALGSAPVAMNVGAQTANATTAIFDMAGNDTTLSTLSGSSLGVIQSSTIPATLWVHVPSSPTSTYAGTLIDGSGGLTLRCEGPGTLVLTGSNTYTGGTTIDGGTLQLGNGGSSGSISDGSGGGTGITNNGILAFNRADSVTVAGQINGTGGVVQMGPGTLSLTSYNGYSGGTTVSGGTLSFVTNSLGSGPVRVDPGNGKTAGLAWNNGTVADLTIHGLTLASGNTVFDLGGAGVNNPVAFYTGTIAGTGSLEITDGTLQIGWGGTTGSLGNVSAVTIDSSGTLAFDRNDTAQNPYIVTGAIGGDGGVLQKLGYLVLTGSNTYGGGTTLSGGTLQLGNGGGSGSVAGNIYLNSSYSSLVYNRSDSVTVSSQISGSGSLLQMGPGRLILTGTNTYGNATIKPGAVLEIQSTNSVGSGSVADSGSLVFNAPGEVDFNGGNNSISGPGSVVQEGGGLLVLGNNTYSGGTTLTAGTIKFGSNGLGTTGPVWVDPGNGNTAGLTWTTSTPDLTSASRGLTLNSGNTLFTLGSNSVAFTGTIAGTGSLEIGGGTLQIGNNTTTGSLGNVSAVTLDSGGVLAFYPSSTSTFTVGGAIAGSGSLLQKGGTLVLTGSNTYSGGTSVSGGTLTLGNGGGSGSVAGNVYVYSGDTLAYNRSDSVTLSGQLTGSGNLLQMGPGRLILTGANAYTNATIKPGAVLEIDSANSVGTGSVADSGSLVFNAASGGTVPVTGTISGPGSLVQQGSGSTVYLSNGSNTYSGGTTLTAGTLKFGSNGLGTTGPVWVDPGNGNTAGLTWTSSTPDLTAVGRGLTLNSGNTLFTLGGYSVSFTGAIAGTGSLEIGGGTLQIGNYTNTGSLGSVSAVTLDSGGVLAFDRSDTSTVAGAIAGSGSVIQKAGTLILTGANTYSGGTTVSASGGTLQVGNGTSGGSLGSGPVSISSGALVFNTTGTCTVAGSISGSSIGGVVQKGPGTLALTNNSNNYSGGTTVSGGSLDFTAHALGTYRVAVNPGAGNTATLIWDQSAGANTVDLTAQSGGYGLTLSSGTTTFNLNGQLVTFGNSLTGTNYVIAGTGSLQISGGTLELLNDSGLGTLSSVVLAGNGYLEFARNSGTSNSLSTPISGTGGLIQGGADTLTVTVSTTFTGTTLVSGGTLTLGNALGLQDSTLDTSGAGKFSFGTFAAVTLGGLTGGGALPLTNASLAAVTLSLGNNSLSISPTYSGVLSGAGKLIKIGSDTQVLAGSNIYTGGTTISAGILQIGAGGTTGSLPAGAIADTGSTSVLAFDRSDNYTFSNAINGAGGVMQMGGGTLSLTGANTYGGGTTLTAGVLSLPSTLGSGGVVVNPGSGNTASILWSGTNTTDLSTTPGLTFASGTALLNLGTNNVAFHTAISGSGGLTETGASTLTLDAANTFTGTTLVSGGTLALGTVATGLQDSTLDPSGAGTFSFGSFTAVTLGGLTGSGALPLTNASSQAVALSVGNNNANATYSGVLSGGSGSKLIKIGTGTQVLSGNNTFTGGTTISTGTLQLGAGGGAGSLATTAAIVDNGVLALDRSDVPYVLANQITGTGGVRQMGSGTLSLTGSNNYTGGTSVTNGEVAAENQSAIPSGSLLSIGANGSLVLGTPGAAEPLGLLSGGAGPLDSQSSTSSIARAAPALSGGGVNAVPEPGTLALLAAAAACGLAAAWRSRRGEG